MFSHAVYVDIGRSAGDMGQLSFSFDGDSGTRMFDIKVTQVECTNANA